METSERLRCRIAEFARELREEFGAVSPDEQGCLLSPLEDWGVQVGDLLSCELIEQQLATAPIPEEEQEPCCPKCQRPGRRKPDRRRRIETRRGAVHLTEPECYCDRCRRSFFPSDTRVGDGA